MSRPEVARAENFHRPEIQSTLPYLSTFYEEREEGEEREGVY
jgi:hypothetical protein